MLCFANRPEKNAIFDRKQSTILLFIKTEMRSTFAIQKNCFWFADISLRLSMATKPNPIFGNFIALASRIVLICLYYSAHESYSIVF